jgi:glycosyltransferase involved in cell wall biosynthesis
VKILHVASGDLWAGAEVQIFLLTTELARLPGLTVRAALMNEGLLASRLREAGVGVDVFDEAKMRSLSIMRQLRRLLRSYRPDILHTHRMKENLLGLAANATSLRVPVVRTVHGSNEYPASWSNPVRKARELADDLSGRFGTSRVISVSADLTGRLRQRGYRNVTTIANGVDMDALHCGQMAPPFRQRHPTARHVGFVGRLEAVKRGDIFLELAANIIARQTGEPFRFHVFGDGSQRAPLQTMASRMGIAAHVDFHGHQPGIVSWLGSLSVLVLCSDHEGMPMTLLEAMAIGTPVVAHAVGGIPEVMRGNVGGVLVQRHDAAAYADAVLEVLERWSPSDAGASRQRVSAHYSVRQTAASTADVYARCLAAAGRTPASDS